MRGSKKKRARLTVILCPPAEVATTNDIVEHEANEDPRYIVEGRCRRHVTSTSEDKREVKILEESKVELLVQHPLAKW